MEFFVVDPKQHAYSDWTDKVREFLGGESMNFNESQGEIYYLGDDVATPWAEDSVLFTVDGDEGGLIEVRDRDENFYVFIDDLDLFDEREVTDSIGFRGVRMGPLYGFRWNSRSSCRFHAGPSVGNHYFCKDDERDVPPRLHLEGRMGAILSSCLLAGRKHIPTPRSEGDQCRKGLLGFRSRCGLHPSSVSRRSV